MSRKFDRSLYPLCPKCKAGRLEPFFTNFAQGIDDPDTCTVIDECENCEYFKEIKRDKEQKIENDSV